MYTPESLEISSELLNSFEKQAETIVNEALVNVSKEEINIAIKGAIATMIAIYKKNNGIPSIPFPISLSTVDMICISSTNEGIQVMMGRKPGQPKWQFPGGFRDPGETSRFAASRELKEEANLSIDSKRLELIGELFVDDIRYRNTPHKITTQIFICRLANNEMYLTKPGDDLGEIQWYSLDELKADTSIIRDIHLPLFDMLVKHLHSSLIVDDL
jgi:8-oxo-dGTP pyrophosphatase MutT (NUDIX family)